MENKEQLNADIEDFNFDEDTLLSIYSSNDLPHSQNDEAQLDERNIIYTKLLSIYSDYLSSSIKSKENYKKRITITLLIILGGISFGCMVLYFLVLNTNEVDKATNYFSMFTIFASFIGTIIIIPMHIVKYVFNENEIQQIGDVIKNIQLYDKAVREDLYKVKFNEIEENKTTQN